MTDSERRIYQNKKDFVEDMDITLGAYPEFGLKSIEYKKDEFDEYLRIAYRDGNVSWICVTGDSTGAILGAILGAIANSVRGKFANGTVLSGSRKDKLESKTDWEEI